jgi:ABC-type phosphate transport system permease subunit
MTLELIAMLGGGVAGFVMKMIASQVENQTRLFDRMIQKQSVADASADLAAKRTGSAGVQMRRIITFSVIFAIVIAPFIFAFMTDVPITIQKDSHWLFGLFSSTKWESIQGFVILPEIRQTALAIVGFYFGSSQVK